MQPETLTRSFGILIVCSAGLFVLFRIRNNDNNASEQALKSPKRHQAVSGYWHSTDTLRGYLRVRSYLASARGHGIRAIDAIHTALTGNPWLPIPATT